MPSSETSRRRVEAEIRELHDFISAWFRGDLPPDPGLFERAFTSRLAPDFLNIQPNGGELRRQDLVESLEKGHGSNPDFQISVDQVRIISDGTEYVTVLYVEDQRGARNTEPSDNRRISTAVLQPDGNRFLWCHLQETAQPFPE